MPKVPGPFAPVRDGVIDHHREMTWPEIGVFHHLLNRAIRDDKHGKVGLCPRLGSRAISEDMGKSRNTVKRALQGLELAHYIERSDSGIVVLNFNGAEPQAHPGRTIRRSGPREGPGHKRVRGGSIRGSPHRVARGSVKGASKGPPNKRRRRTTDGDGKPSVTASPKQEKLPIENMEGIVVWSTIDQKVEMDDQFRTWLKLRLAKIAGQEKIPAMNQHQLQESWAALNLEMMKPSMNWARGNRLVTWTVRWFERRLRTLGAIRSRNPTKQQETDDAFREVMKKALEEEAHEEE